MGNGTGDGTISPHTLIPAAVPLRVQTLSLISAARRSISHIIIVSQDSYRKLAPAAAYGREMCKRNRASDVRRPRRAFLPCSPTSRSRDKSNRRVRHGYSLQFTGDGFQYVTRSWARLTPSRKLEAQTGQNAERHASRPHHHHHCPQRESRRCHLKTQDRDRFLFS